MRDSYNNVLRNGVQLRNDCGKFYLNGVGGDTWILGMHYRTDKNSLCWHWSTFAVVFDIEGRNCPEIEGSCIGIVNVKNLQRVLSLLYSVVE